MVPSAVVDAEHGIPDERPQRRREYSGAPSTLGLAALLIVVVGVAVWWFELRGDGGGLADDGYGVIDLPAGQNPTGRAPAADTGRAAPNFTLARIDESAAVSLTDYRGKWVVLNFWASWCGPCRAMMPVLNRLSQRYAAQGLTVIGLTDEAPSIARQVGSSMGIRCTLATSDVAMGSYRVDSLPTMVMIDRAGRVREVTVGMESPRELESAITRLLAEPTP